LDLPESNPRLVDRPGGDQIANRLRAREVQPAVTERAIRELAGPRENRSLRDGRPCQRFEDRRAAVRPQLSRRLARVGPAGRERDEIAVIHVAAVSIEKRSEARGAVAGTSRNAAWAEQGVRDAEGVR